MVRHVGWATEENWMLMILKEKGEEMVCPKLRVNWNYSKDNLTWAVTGKQTQPDVCWGQDPGNKTLAFYCLTLRGYPALSPIAWIPTEQRTRKPMRCAKQSTFWSPDQHTKQWKMDLWQTEGQWARNNWHSPVCVHHPSWGHPCTFHFIL